MAVLVKICGITTPDASDAALSAGADFVGLNFHPSSRRFVDLERAAALAARMRGRVRQVALMVDPSDDQAAAIVKATAPDYLQFHGRETPARVEELSARFGRPAIKVFGVAEAADLAGVTAYDAVAAMYLFDARPPQGAANAGGHGVAFDWRVLSGHRFARPWLLAGGLNPENVSRAIAMTDAPGVDVSSGVESEPGRKSPALIAAFTAAAKAAQHASEARS